MNSDLNDPNVQIMIAQAVAQAAQGLAAGQHGLAAGPGLLPAVPPDSPPTGLAGPAVSPARHRPQGPRPTPYGGASSAAGPAGAIPKAGGPTEFSLRTPVKPPAPGTDLELFRKYVESKFAEMENQIKDTSNLHYDDRDDWDKWRARHDQLHAVQEHRANLLDARVTATEAANGQAADKFREVEKFVVGMSVQTLKERLEKFAVDIEKAFSDVHQVEADLSNHIGTIAETYGQLQNKIDLQKQSLDAHASTIGWISTNTTDQLNKAAERISGLESRVSGMPVGPSVVPPGLPSGALTQAFQGGKCHCHHVDQLMAEMMAVKTDVQNLGHLSGYVTVCQSLDARIKAIEDSLNAQKSQVPATSADTMAGGNDSWTNYLSGGVGGIPGYASGGDASHGGGGNPHGGGGGLPSGGGGYPGGGGFGYPGGGGFSGGFSGGGGFPGSGGGGYPGGGGQWPRLQGQSPGFNPWNLEKSFDDKVAMSSEHSFDGNSNGEKWRVKIEGYWISKLPALVEILDWVVKQDAKPITRLSLETQRQAEVSSGAWKAYITDDVLERISGLIWGFLNLALKGEAHRAFMMADRLNGFEGWRIVVSSIHRGRENRQQMLRKMVRAPQPINKLEDVEMGIITYDSLIRDYVAVEGTPRMISRRKATCSTCFRRRSGRISSGARRTRPRRTKSSAITSRLRPTMSSTTGASSKVWLAWSTFLRLRSLSRRTAPTRWKSSSPPSTTG